MPPATTSRPLGFLACASAGALWGTGFFFGKIALREVSVGHMVFYRFLFAALPMLPLAKGRGERWTGAEWRLLTVAAFFGIPLQFLVQFKGLSITSLSHAALMIGTLPVILAAAAALFLKERLDAVGWTAMLSSTAGACMIALGGHDTNGTSSLLGDSLIVLSVVIALVWLLGNKKLLLRHNALELSARSLLLGTAMLFVWVPLQYGMPPVHGISLKAWLALAASGVLCTAATNLLWNWGMTQVPASQGGIFINLEPVIGSVLGVTMLHEHLGLVAWVGGALIVGAAVVLSTRSDVATDSIQMETA
jgi:drug/metabolite transporter (DMT)-like permease